MIDMKKRKSLIKSGELPQWIEYIENLLPEGAMKIDGFDDCICGIVERFGMDSVLLYDRNSMIEKMISQDGMEYEEAIEFFEYNTIGAYISDDQPIYLHINPDLFQPVKTTRSSHLIPRFSGTIDNCPPDAPRSNDWLGL